MEKQKTIIEAEEAMREAPKLNMADEKILIDELEKKIKVPEQDGWELKKTIKTHTSTFDEKTGKVTVDLNVEFLFIQEEDGPAEELEMDISDEVVNEGVDIGDTGNEFEAGEIALADIDELSLDETEEEFVEFDEDELTGELDVSADADTEELAEVISEADDLSTAETRQLAGEALLDQAGDSVQATEKENVFSTFMDNRELLNMVPVVQETPEIAVAAEKPNYKDNPFYINLNAPMAPVFNGTMSSN